MDASLMVPHKELEAENRRFKMYVEDRLKAKAIKEALEKKVVRPIQPREMARIACMKK
jgi:hypothetical protein